MPCSRTHPVDDLTDGRLREMMLRVDPTGFPADLQHLWTVEHDRYRQTLRRIPPARGDNLRLLDLGSSRPWVPFYRLLLGYRHIVLNSSYPDAGFVTEPLSVRGADTSDLRVSVFDVERDPFPHDDETFDVVLCLEVLEHLAIDPMAMMSEANRVLKPGGLLILTTPNAVRTRNIVNVLMGEHPLGWSSYNGFDTNRHNREYTPAELELLLQASGMAAEEVTTFGCKSMGSARTWLARLMSAVTWPMRRCPPHWRNDVIVAVGRKVSSCVTRRPSWLYFDMAERAYLRPSPALHSPTKADLQEATGR